MECMATLNSSFPFSLDESFLAIRSKDRIKGEDINAWDDVDGSYGRFFMLNFGMTDVAEAIFPPVTGLPSLERIVSGTTRGDSEEVVISEEGGNRVGEEVQGEDDTICVGGEYMLSC